MYQIGNANTSLDNKEMINSDESYFFIHLKLLFNQKVLKPKFNENLAVKTIYRDEFQCHDKIVNGIYFPPSLKELKKGLCWNLKTIISPLNGQFIF